MNLFTTAGDQLYPCPTFRPGYAVQSTVCMVHFEDERGCVSHEHHILIRFSDSKRLILTNAVKLLHAAFSVSLSLVWLLGNRNKHSSLFRYLATI